MGFRVIQIRDVNELLRLLLNCLQYLTVPVSESVDSDATYQVQVPLSLGVEEIDSFSPLQDEIWPAIGLQDTCFLQANDLLSSSVFPAMVKPPSCLQLFFYLDLS